MSRLHDFFSWVQIKSTQHLCIALFFVLAQGSKMKSKNVPKASISAFCTVACQQKSSNAFRHQSIWNLELGFFKKGTRFPIACTSIRDYLSPGHFIRKRPSKRREVNIWLTILHSMDSLVQWDQRVWDGGMAKVAVVSNTSCDRNVEKHPTEFLRCWYRRVCQKQNQN